MPDVSGDAAAAERPAPAAAETIRAPCLVVDDFLPLDLALAMRKDIEDHFANPPQHRAETHQIWNYWHVPGLYTYLRTMPEKIFARPRIDALMGALRAWSAETLGMPEVTWPYLSLYVTGCAQGLHNDAANGRFAFVYSLTKDERRTSGGDTIVFREGDPFRNNLGRAAAGSSFYESVPPRFNRLVVFDDRMPHAVERVDGSMDPVEGRFVLHGHIRDGGGPMVAGALPPQAAVEPVVAALRAFAQGLGGEPVGVVKGPLVARLRIAPSGAVARAELLVDRLTQMDPRFPEPGALAAKLMAMLSAIAFAPAEGETSVTLPIFFGGEATPPGA